MLNLKSIFQQSYKRPVVAHGGFCNIVFQLESWNEKVLQKAYVDQVHLQPD